jgi:hypothetical protein
VTKIRAFSTQKVKIYHCNSITYKSIDLTTLGGIHIAQQCNESTFLREIL